MSTSASRSSKCHLSDGKLRPIMVHVFTIISGTKRWFSQVASPSTPTHKPKGSGPEVQNPKHFSMQEQKCKMQCQTHSHWILVTLWTLMSLKTSWLSAFPRPSEEGKWNNAPKLRRCFFQWRNRALPATFRLTIKPTLKWRGQLATAQFSPDKAENWTAAPPGDLHIWFTQKVSLGPQQNFRWHPAATQGAPTKYTVCIFQFLPEYGNKDLERKHHIRCDPSEQENDLNYGLLNAGGTEMAFQVLLWAAHSHLLWFTLGISRRYSTSNFLIDLDFTWDFCRTNHLRNCVIQNVNVKKRQKTQIATITNT